MTLFDPGPANQAEHELPISAGRRLTAKNRALLEAGIHPATRMRLRPEGGTCGECEHLVVIGGHSRRYLKCDKHRLGPSASAASDVRAGWPACTLFVPEPLPEPEPAPWRPPAATRWCLVGRGTNSGPLTLITEYGTPNDPSAALEEPERGTDWLEATGIGVSPTHHDGLAGWAWWATMEADRRRDHDAATIKAKKSSRKRQPEGDAA